MDTFSVENTCRICLKQKDTVYSLFRKLKGIYPYEKLKKVGVKADADDIYPPCICSDCQIELDVTLKFLEKCEKSNQILSAQLSRRSFKSEVSIDQENNAFCIENTQDIETETNIDNITQNLEKSCNNIKVSSEEAKCHECGSKRRCRHWSPPSTHTCPYCQKVFGRKFNFKLHLARHSGSHEWWCRSCGARTLSRWLAAAYCAPRPRRPCPVAGCGKTYTTNTNLNTHLRVHSGERPFECNDCGKKFTSKNTLSDHLRIHTGALPYICPVCGKRFRTNKLSAHIATHRRRNEKAPPAPRVRPEHPPTPAHACSLCPARYHHRQSLNKHVKKQHSQKPLSAEIAPNVLTKRTQSDL